MDAIIDGASELGVPRNDDFNGAQQEGVGYYQLFTRNGLRCSTAVGYLKPARKRANLRVETEARATTLVMEGNLVAKHECGKTGSEQVANVANVLA